MNFNNIKDWTIPQGSVTRVTDSHGIVIWEKSGGHDYSQDYFFIEDISGQSNTVSIKKNGATAPTIEVFYSTDQTNWSSMGSTSTTAKTATIPANGRLYLKASANSWGDGNRSFYNTITCTGNHNVGGNIMSLLYGDNFKNQIEFPSGATYNFYGLFENNIKVVSAANFVLPATTLTDNCYNRMFYGCTSLTTAPALPATTLVNSCYYNMFYGCTSLTTAPVLPATKLTTYCYRYMFNGCTRLTTAPALPATTLAINCYEYMFQGCTALTTAPALPATTLANYCYKEMFQGCTALTQAPVLPATTLVNSCYRTMFYGCTKLNKVTTYAQNISASYCLTNWLNNVAPTGDFYNLGGATYPSGVSGIPTGWTEHNSL